MYRFALIMSIGFFVPVIALAQLDLGSDGSDGAYVFNGNDDDDGNPNLQTIDLGRAATVSDWTVPSPVAGRGVYDPQQWAVVFKFTTITLPANRTIRFKNHPSFAPVVWLATGDIDIRGAVVLDGAMGNLFYEPIEYAEPGPGGFRGGRSAGLLNANWSDGFGPGGGILPPGAGSSDGCGGTYSTKGLRGGSESTAPTYGTIQLTKLIGGSGGSASRGADAGNGGGAGGGAMLIGGNSNLTVRTNAALTANGGCGRAYNRTSGAGSGGAWRLIANRLAVETGAYVRALGGGCNPTCRGGSGRVRYEANEFSILTESEPTMSGGSPGIVFASAQSNAPSVVVQSIDGQSMPLDPRAGFFFTGIDGQVPNSGPVSVVVQGTNIPVTPTPAFVYLRVTLRTGAAMSVPTVLDAPNSNNSSSRWEASVPFGAGISAVQALADLP